MSSNDATLTSDDARPASAAIVADAELLAARRYQQLDEVARGGAGRIVRAHDLALDREVALKLPLDPDGSARLRAEAAVLAHLQHPAIVPVYDAGVGSDGLPFFAMKLVDGESLREAIGHAASFEARLAMVPVVVAIAEAVAYAHARGVVHRDLKPGNVLVGRYGETIVIDWGLATAAGEHARGSAESTAGPTPLVDTMTGAVLGTPAYMPPEQARGAAIDARADVYAIGAILYHLLAGAPPFTGGDALARVQAGPPEPIDQVQPRVPRDLAAIVAKAMARDPAQRYPSAEQLADDLVRFLGGRLVAARRYSLAARLRRWASRRRAALAIAAVAIAGVAVAIALATHTPMRTAPGAACDQSAQRVRALWTPARADAIRAAFAATGLSYGKPAADAAIAILGRQAGAIADARIDACRATFARGEQSAGTLQIRMLCLDQRTDQVDAVAGALGHADALAVDRAPDATDALDPVSTCADDKALLLQTAPPTDAPTRAAIATVQARLAAAGARFDLGDPPPVSDLEPIVTEARRIGWCGTLASALVDLGEAQLGAAADVAAAAAAEEPLREAVRVADGCGADDERVRALLQLDNALARGNGDAQASLEIAREARSAAERAENPALAAEAESMESNAQLGLGDVDGAIKLGEEALATAVRAAGGGPPGDPAIEHDLAEAYLQHGDLDRALALAGSALDHDRARFGPEHPSLTPDLELLAIVQQTHGDNAQAMATIDHALAIARARFGPDHEDTLELEVNAATLYGHAGKVAEARDRYLALLPRVQKAYGADHDLVATLLDALASADDDLDDFADARAVTRQLIEMREKSRGPESAEMADALHRLAKVEHDAGAPGAAAAAWVRIVAIDDRVLPGDSADLGADLAGLGNAWAEAGAPAKAVPAFQRALIVLRDAAGADPSLIQQITSWLTAHGGAPPR